MPMSRSEKTLLIIRCNAVVSWVLACLVFFRFVCSVDAECFSYVPFWFMLCFLSAWDLLGSLATGLATVAYQRLALDLRVKPRIRVLTLGCPNEIQVRNLKHVIAWQSHEGGAVPK